MQVCIKWKNGINGVKEGSKESVWSKRTRERLLSQKERLHRILKIDLISKIS